MAISTAVDQHGYDRQQQRQLEGHGVAESHNSSSRVVHHTFPGCASAPAAAPAPAPASAPAAPASGAVAGIFRRSRQQLPVLLLPLLLLVLLAQLTAGQQRPDGGQHSGISYHTHYPVASERPNRCEVAFRSQPYNITYHPNKYIPFVGTSIVRDSQLLVLRLLYSLDYPVKHFIIVVPRRAMQGGRVLAYELRHIRDYGTNIIIIACRQPPSVTEGWNAVFHALPDEPWGIYNARDTAWEPGSLAKVAEQFWPMVEKNEVDVGLVGYSNLDAWSAELAKFNVFMLTRKIVERFGYFDESIYPAFCEDDDFVFRLKLLQPPGVFKTLKDVLVLHGSRPTTMYISGTNLESEEGHDEEHKHSGLTVRKGGVNCNYFLRKWGCRSESAKQWVRSLHDTCKHKTPFGRDLPVWYWRTTKEQRENDKEVELRHLDKEDKWELWDLRQTKKIFDVPNHYGEWGGYYESGSTCRLTGDLGRILPPPPPKADGSPSPNCM